VHEHGHAVARDGVDDVDHGREQPLQQREPARARRARRREVAAAADRVHQAVVGRAHRVDVRDAHELEAHAHLPSMSVTIFHRFPSRNLSKIVTATGR
jgi:hypothetical protein